MGVPDGRERRDGDWGTVPRLINSSAVRLGKVTSSGPDGRSPSRGRFVGNDGVRPECEVPMSYTIRSRPSS